MYVEGYVYTNSLTVRDTSILKPDLESRQNALQKSEKSSWEIEIFQIGLKTTGLALFRQLTLFYPNASIWVLKTLRFLRSFRICRQKQKIPSMKIQTQAFQGKSLAISFNFQQVFLDLVIRLGWVSSC